MKQDWEKEFEKKFTTLKGATIGGIYFDYDATPSEIKQFIKDLLQKQKEEIIQELHKLRTNKGKKYQKEVKNGDLYNACIYDIEQTINNLKERL